MASQHRKLWSVEIVKPHLRQKLRDKGGAGVVGVRQTVFAAPAPDGDGGASSCSHMHAIVQLQCAIVPCAASDVIGQRGRVSARGGAPRPRRACSWGAARKAARTLARCSAAAQRAICRPGRRIRSSSGATARPRRGARHPNHRRARIRGGLSSTGAPAARHSIRAVLQSMGPLPLSSPTRACVQASWAPARRRSSTSS